MDERCERSDTRHPNIRTEAPEQFESRPQLVDDFSNDNRVSDKEGSVPDGVENSFAGLWVAFSPDSIAFGAAGRSLQSCQFVEMELGPFHFGAGPLNQGVHVVYSGYGRTDPKDAERLRDAHPDSRRVGTEPPQDRQAEAEGLNSSAERPGEVTSQTEPAHRHDGYSATHTRSGSPEDA